MITVLPNYRLAPGSPWPSGPEDVAAVWRWLQDELPALGGDPSRIVLLGESAGAAHVAAACLMQRWQPPGWCGQFVRDARACSPSSRSLSTRPAARSRASRSSGTTHWAG